MNQRQSIPIPKAKEFPGKDATLFITRYMLDSKNVEIPPIFLNLKEVHEMVQNAYTSKNVPLNLMSVDPDSDLISVVSTLTVLCINEPASCIIDFGKEHILSIVGYKSQFYVIDLFHEIFYVTSAPEHEIETYANMYGLSNEKIKVEYYNIMEEDEESAKPKKKVKKNKE